MIYLLLAYISYPFVFFVSRFLAKRDKGSVLVFQTAKIGDMVCTTPVFRELKKAYPNGRIGVVIDPVTEPVVRHNPYIDEIILFDRAAGRGVMAKVRFARELYRKGYSSALILMPNTANILSAFWAMIPVRVAVFPDYAGATQRRLLKLNTHIEYHIHPRMSMETYLRSLRHLGIDKWEMDKEVYPEPGADEKARILLKGAKGPFIGLAIGTGNALKDWGKDNFLTLAGKIIDQTEYTVVLLGSEKDATTGEEIIGYAKSDGRVVNLCGKLTLTEIPSLIKMMSLLVGVDTGLIYMADALGVPVVVVAGPCDMSDQRPTGNSVILQLNGVWGCVPCSHTFKTPYDCRYGHKRCLIEITPDDVFKGLRKILPADNGVKA